MINKPIDLLTKEDVDALIADEVSEGRNLDYKLTLPGATDDDKREFLSDVSSFANSGGGYLVYGIREDKGLPTDAPGVSLPDLDAEQLRLQNLLRDGIQPRIIGLQMRFIPGFPTGHILIIQIPKSWNPPHMVTFKNLSRFFTRTGAGKHQMDLNEIRSAFALAADLPERIKRFRDERVALIAGGHTPILLEAGPKFALHIIPLSSFASDAAVELSAVNQHNTSLRPMGSSGYSPRINIDGLLTYSGTGRNDGAPASSYVQMFRSGRIEAVDSDFTGESNGTRYIPSGVFEKEILQGFATYLKTLETIGIPIPIVISATMIGVKDVIMYVGARRGHSGAPIDRDIVSLADVTLMEYGKDATEILHPIFDSVWNSCGFAGSLNYKDGKWSPS